MCVHKDRKERNIIDESDLVTSVNKRVGYDVVYAPVIVFYALYLFRYGSIIVVLHILNVYTAYME